VSDVFSHFLMIIRLVSVSSLRRCAKACKAHILIKKGADPVTEAPTRVGSGEENNRSKVLPP
jgi:hypothetical protein